MQAQYKTYDSYKDSGVPWLGKIPKDWEVTRNLGLFDERKEVNFPEAELLSVTIEQGIIKQSEITAKKDSSNEDKRKYKRVLPDDLAYNKMRMWQGAIGRSQYEGIVSPAYIILEPRNKAYSRFYHYLYRTSIFIKEANRNSYGLCDDMNSLRYEDFKTIHSPVPPEDQVNRIVAFLDQKTGEIDAAIEKKQRLIELLKEQKSILINQAVTKGLNPSAPMKDSGIEWIGQIPAHWEVKRIKHFAKIGSGFAFKSDKFSAEGTPVIRIGDIAKPIQPDSCVKTSEVKIPDMFKVVAGDVLIALSGATTGKIGFYDSSEIAFVNQRVALIRNSEKWFRHLLDADFLQRQIKLIAAGSAQENISTGSIANIFAPIPPANERAEIANWLLSLESECDKTINQQLSSIEKLQEFKQTLIAHAVTGKIKV